MKKHKMPQDEAKEAEKTIYNDGIKYSKERQGINENPNLPQGFAGEQSAHPRSRL